MCCSGLFECGGNGVKNNECVTFLLEKILTKREFVDPLKPRRKNVTKNEVLRN